MIRNDQQFELRLARSGPDLIAAQRLRYRVFVRELGGNGPLVDHDRERELDEFDSFCDHLILIDRFRDARLLDHVVGVYRLLPGSRVGPGATQVSRFYSEGEYDLSTLKSSARPLLELGRSCVHPDYRGGTAMYKLWSGLADYVAVNRIEILFGVASFHGLDLETMVEPLSCLHHFHLAPPELRPATLDPDGRRISWLAPDQINRLRAMNAMPSLIKAYLRLGGCVADGIYRDRAFNTTDVCLVMDTALVPDRQRAIYARQTEQAE
jgi:putative hemolysin